MNQDQELIATTTAIVKALIDHDDPTGANNIANLVARMFLVTAQSIRTNRSGNGTSRVDHHTIQADGVGSATYLRKGLTIQFIEPHILEEVANNLRK